jgi:hypothetical protein
MGSVRFYANVDQVTEYVPSTIRGAWDDTTKASATALYQIATNTTLTPTSEAETSISGEWDVILRRFVTQPATSAGTLTGTMGWTFYVQESSASADMYFHVHAYVTQGDSDTPRGTILTDAIGGTEWHSSLSIRSDSGVAISDLAIQVGDRIVVEVGYRATNTSATSYVGYLYYNTGSSFTSGYIDFSDASSLFASQYAFLDSTIETNLVPAMTVCKSWNISVSTVACVADVPAVMVTTGSTVSPATVVCVADVPAVTVTTTVSASTLHDEFVGVSLEPWWNSVYGSLELPYIYSGYCRIPCGHNGGVQVYAGINSSGPNGVDSWTLNNSYIICEITELPLASTATVANFLFIAMTSTPGVTAGFVYDAVAGYMGCGNWDSWVDPNYVTFPYSNVTHRWIRIVSNGSTLAWETSPDAHAWTTQRVDTQPAWVDIEPTKILAEATRDGGTNDYFGIDNINVISTTVSPVTVACVADVPAVTVATGSTVSPATVVCVADVPAVTVTLPVDIHPACVVCVADVPAVTVVTDINPATVACVADVPAVTVTTGSTVSPATVACVADVPAVTVVAIISFGSLSCLVTTRALSCLAVVV